MNQEHHRTRHGIVTAYVPTDRRAVRSRPLVLLAALGVVAAGDGCDRSQAGSPRGQGDQLVVFAAASLREAFTALARDFQHERPGVEVVFNFAGTQELRRQIEQGAGADVFAAADERHMDELLRAGKVLSPVPFAENEPVVVVTAHARGAEESSATTSRIETFADLPEATRLVIGAPDVPIGRYTLAILDRANRRFGDSFRSRVEARVVSQELNVRQVLAKVMLGEADAGIVYRTDASTSLGRVRVVPIPSDINVVATYPIAVVAHAARGGPAAASPLARAWIELVLSADGRRALRAAGFLTRARSGTEP